MRLQILDRLVLAAMTLCLALGVAVAPATAQSDQEWSITSLSSEIRNLTQTVSPAVVQIYTSSFGSLMGSTPQGAALFGKQQATGSGIILDSDGYILTNNHVVQGAKRVQVRLSREAVGMAGGTSILETGGAIVAAKVLGNLRTWLAERLKLVPESSSAAKNFKMLWVTDFPLLEWDEEDKRYYACHHPFTSPLEEDVDSLESDPGAVRARAYDLVVNGSEIGGGSIRIHSKDVQDRVFRALGMDEEESRRKFEFLLEALSYGAPPHGGIALGVERIIMALTGADSIRDVIAFPKTTSASDLMAGSPSLLDEGQLQELSLKTLPIVKK